MVFNQLQLSFDGFEQNLTTNQKFRICFQTGHYYKERNRSEEKRANKRNEIHHIVTMLSSLKGYKKKIRCLIKLNSDQLKRIFSFGCFFDFTKTNSSRCVEFCGEVSFHFYGLQYLLRYYTSRVFQNFVLLMRFVFGTWIFFLMQFKYKRKGRITRGLF